MTIACQTVMVSAPPANITATAMTLDKTTCTSPCSVIATITWTNNGGTAGTFAPGVTVDGGVPITLPSESLAAGASISHALSITGLSAGPRSICPSPN